WLPPANAELSSWIRPWVTNRLGSIVMPTGPPWSLVLKAPPMYRRDSPSRWILPPSMPYLWRARAWAISRRCFWMMLFMDSLLLPFARWARLPREGDFEGKRAPAQRAAGALLVRAGRAGGPPGVAGRLVGLLRELEAH